MIKYVLILSIFIPFLNLDAQTNNISQLGDIDTFESLSFVYGWSRNPKNDKWTKKEREIKDLDNFENYSIISFSNSFDKYVAIIKQSENKGLAFYDVSVLDYNDYVSQISLWEEHTILKFPILKRIQVTLKKEDIPTRDILGLNDLSDLLSSPRDYFVYQYKLMKDSTVKFLFYLEICSADECLVSGLNLKNGNQFSLKDIGKDSLYNSFFYKTMSKYFTSFTDSPLRSNNTK